MLSSLNGLHSVSGDSHRGETLQQSEMAMMQLSATRLCCQAIYTSPDVEGPLLDKLHAFPLVGASQGQPGGRGKKRKAEGGALDQGENLGRSGSDKGAVSAWLRWWSCRRAGDTVALPRGPSPPPALLSAAMAAVLDARDWEAADELKQRSSSLSSERNRSLAEAGSVLAGFLKVWEHKFPRFVPPSAAPLLLLLTWACPHASLRRGHPWTRGIERI